jgi:polar amino acid transport system permease protein
MTMGGHLNINHLMFLGQGALWTIGLSVIALIGGGIVGFVIALARISPLKSVRIASGVYVQLIQGTPLLVILFLGYFGLAAIGLKVSSLTAAGASLTLYVAAYLGEIWRGCIQSVPRSQWEAAECLALTRWERMRRVILPQALRVTVPPLISQTLNLWKDTSIATVIGVAELMYQAAKVESATFRSAEAFAFATAAYLTVSLAITGLAAWYHHRYPARTV